MPGSSPPRRYDEDAPTQVDDVAPPIPRASAPAPPPSGTTAIEGGSQPTSRGASSSSLVTARETLLLQEIHRTRTFLRIAIGLALSQGITVLATGGDAAAASVVLAACAIVVLVCGVVLFTIRTDEGYTIARATP